jgi:ADP-L-glycero-D-manno-heptose 6-epimerase
VKHQAKDFPKQYAGLKFFNVYGPNEYYKGGMASMIFHGYRQICETGRIRLFKSCNPNYSDGGQLRDFVYVKDVCDVILWLMEHPEVNGLFNVGTGVAGSFNELASAVFAAVGARPNIEYIDMPENLKGKYQYYTKADMSKIRSAGYGSGFYSLKDGAFDYVCRYLAKGFENY